MLVSTLLVAACGGGGEDDTLAFSYESSSFMLQPGQEEIYCTYFHTSNTAPVAINQWEIEMTQPGIHHMIFFTGGREHADGIDMTNTCGLDLDNLGANRAWILSSANGRTVQNLPLDDGAGKPLAQLIQPNTLGVFQTHYINATDNPIEVKSSLKAFGIAPGTPYTQTDVFVTYNEAISVPPNAVNDVEAASCNVPQGKYWHLSTHSHKQTKRAEIKDGDTTLFETTDYDHPGERVFESPFYTFNSGKMTWACTYTNDGDNANREVNAGESAVADEMCMGLAYYFPSTGPKFCTHKSDGTCLCN
ncbi:MAG: hypothetical protein M3619_12945 [Myxococcota bacterium]|nr:hypothetical protein [Myxococcota bacterium]